MNGRKIVVIQGHPDARPVHYCHALADAYAAKARLGGHEVRRIEIAQSDFPWLRCLSDEFEPSADPAANL